MTDRPADPSGAPVPDLDALRRKQAEQIKAFQERQARIPASERRPITNPDKYDFPVGMDDEGNFFPPSVADRVPPPPAPNSPGSGPATRRPPGGA